jgi:hypothetical protein
MINGRRFESGVCTLLRGSVVHLPRSPSGADARR